MTAPSRRVYREDGTEVATVAERAEALRQYQLQLEQERSQAEDEVNERARLRRELDQAEAEERHDEGNTVAGAIAAAMRYRI